MTEFDHVFELIRKDAIRLRILAGETSDEDD